MVGIVALRSDGLIRIALRDKVMVYADQNDFFETHVIGQLQSHVGYGRAFPKPAGHITRKFRAGISCIKKMSVIRWFQESV